MIDSPHSQAVPAAPLAPCRSVSPRLNREFKESASTSARRWTWIVAAAALVGLFVLATTAFRLAGFWLIVDDPLQPAQAVVVLGGHLPFRAMEAAEIFKQGWVREAWLTPGHPSKEDQAMRQLGVPHPSEAEYSRQVLERLGVPAGAIRELPLPTANTHEEMRVIAGALGSTERVIIVTSKYHTRRVKMLWRNTVRDRPAAIVRYTRQDPFEPERWWQTTSDSIAVTREWFGLVNAWAGFPVRSVR